MGFLSNLGNKAAKALDYVSAVIRKPSNILKNPSVGIAESKAIREKTASGEMSLKQNIQKSVVPTVVNTAVAASLVVGGAGLAAKAGETSLKSVATSLIPKSTVGKVVGATVGLPAVAVGTGLVIANPKETAEKVLDAPSAVVNYGINLAKVGAGTGSIKETFTDNPLLAGATAGVLGLAGVKLLGTGGAYLAGQLADNQQDGLLGGNDNLPTTAANNATGSVIPTNTSVPQLPATTVISSSSTKKRKRSKTKPMIQHISQKVNVQVSNNQTKRYLNVIRH